MSPIQKDASSRARPRMHRRKRSAPRPLRCETLEIRRLLVAEGAVYDFSGTYDAAGLIGDVSAVVRWGDGTTSPATSVVGGNATGKLRIRFDYSLDTGGFFSSTSRRNLLQTAADSIIKRFGDDLAAIQPGGILEWQPSVFHPSSGPANQLSGTLKALPKNMPVAANEIIVYAGARDLPGANRGVGGPGSYSFPSSQFTCQTQAECDRKLAQIDAFRDVVLGRGESGALTSPQSDIAPHIGSVSFDNNSNWYFGTDASKIQPGQIDFISVASHEIAHVLGFGIVRTDVISPWTNLTKSGAFAGGRARAAYEGSGNAPIEANHWARSIAQPTLMAAELPTGRRQLISPLDFAAFDDMGWDVLDTRTTVTASHRFPDDGVYPVDVVLKGAAAGEVVRRVADVNVTNVAPTLTVADQTAVVGRALSVTNLGVISDPGFNNGQYSPATVESYTYSIDWGDGTEIDEGTATVDNQGNSSGALSGASFDGSHTYQTPGTKTVTVNVRDDDGGAARRTFSVVVAAPPSLSLELSTSSVDEDDGGGAATLTIRREGSANASAQTVNLSSNDSSEATVPATAVIPSDQAFVTVPVQAIDDALLDGDITATITAGADGFMGDEIDLIVKDRESLSATFSAAEIREDASNSVSLMVRRSNTDTEQELDVGVTGGNPSELDLPISVKIPAGQQQVSIPLSPVDDEDPERTLKLTYVFTASNYQGAEAEIDLLDDEPPLYQNATSRFDVNNNGKVTAADALRIINQLAIRGGAGDLDPNGEPPRDVFVDPNGDYRISAVDALVIINEIKRMHNNPTSEPEAVGQPLVVWADFERDDDDPSERWDVEVSLVHAAVL